MKILSRLNYLLLIILLFNSINITNAGVLQSLDKEITDLAQISAQSVISIELLNNNEKRINLLSKNNSQDYQIQQKKFSFEEKIGDGTGFIISEDGYIVTNSHVIRPNKDNIEIKPSKIQVSLYNNEKYTASIIGTDSDSDIAVIKIDTKGKKLKPIKWGNSDNVKAGGLAMTIGSALGAEHTVGLGIISAISRKKPSISKEALFGDLDYIQTYAQINPGNSGGPLINMNGEVIGITSFIQIAPHTPGFAIPSVYAQNVVNNIIKYGYMLRPSLGLLISDMSEPANDILDIFGRDPNEIKKPIGLIIQDISKGSPADRSGLLIGDIIKSVNNQAVSNAIDFIHDIRTGEVGAVYSMEIYRPSIQKTISISVKSEATKNNN